MTNFNPFEQLDAAILKTAADNLEADEFFQKASRFAQDVQALHSYVAETPRWSSLWDQCQRASSSVALNYGQGLGKLRGFTSNDWLCARGELYECYAGLSIGPDSFCALKPAAKELMGLLDWRIRTLAEKPARCS
jgi:hypothetical protein